ncbi:FAD-dependent monooxygenase [Sphingobacterium sp. SGR-19]|uniref:FAD-dependent monooxygenase n=1 Tax=Sphingobacterium sp. SGR-19 TaxID=2710886 RepID=UPI0013E9DA58|nr:FAD-dependent monooxygenase [Sphingobacterium sp. SGR-19]NGM66346.1 NAD(P)-binding protein [Sphingobacterium sp. SGR-19]
MPYTKTIDSEFAIVGGGVAGLAMAIALQKINKDFVLFEQAKELKGIGAGFGLAANAMRALDLLDLRTEVEQIGYYLDSYNILDHKGRLLVSPDTHAIREKYQQQNFAIHRADLHLFLLSKIKTQKLQLGKKAIRLEQYGDTVTLFFDDGTQHTSHFLIIADGVKSPLRQQLIPSSTPRYSGYTCWRATIDNTEITLDKGTETWGKLGRFGMTPLINNRIYWYACINATSHNPVYRDYKIKDLLTHFQSYHDPIPAILAYTKDSELIWNDIMDIEPLKHLAYDNILLIGDAGHATTPNMGQGACQALEDVAVLLDELGLEKDVKEAFSSFEKRRLPRTKYIMDTSRRIGEIAQWDNSLLISMRNMLLKIMPAKLAQRNLDKLLSVDFMKI